MCTTDLYKIYYTMCGNHAEPSKQLYRDTNSNCIVNLVVKHLLTGTVPDKWNKCENQKCAGQVTIKTGQDNPV